ncbi:hypothetical protein SprV_0501939000 [Sparganum proliferum]
MLRSSVVRSAHDGDHTFDAPPPSITATSIIPFTTPAETVMATTTHPPAPTTGANTPDVPSTISFPITASATRNAHWIPTYPHCYRTFTSRIGPIGHLQIYRTETGESVPGASI